jgi:hypothetical protein
MVTQVIFDVLEPATQGQSETSPSIYGATTDQTSAVITTAGAVATLVSKGILKVRDVLFVNYDVDGTPGQAVYTVTSTSGGSLIGYTIPAGYLQAANNLSDVANAFTSVTNLGIGYLIPFKTVVGQAALASAGSVSLQASTGSQQYRIITLELESGGTNFSGGGGDRLGQVTDGTTVYSVIPAATMQSLVNARWGVTALPNAAAAANATSTAAGASLVFKYSGGTTDYTAGSLTVSGLLLRVA